MTARYSIGIDLGTTNSVLAFVRLDDPKAEFQILNIPQIVGPNETESLASLPSFNYLPTEAEVLQGGLTSFGQHVIGSYARKLAADQPERTVVAAKSWLGHREVDRRGPILPWQADDEVPKISPVEASANVLRHLAWAWQNCFPESPIAEQRVTLTVPASFDVVARELTLEAAHLAQLPDDLILLEEPQAAFYHWIGEMGDNWRQSVRSGDRILVCDCGGGTTDLTLVEVGEELGELELKRVAVGRHLLIGGDNMDLTLAHHVANHFIEKGIKLNAWQSVSLWHACRTAKEVMLTGNGQEQFSVSVLGRGSRLIGGTVTYPLKRSEIESILVEGFFPRCDRSERPDRAIASGFQEIGLPYESDSAITRHVAEFVQDHSIDSSTSSNSGFPSRILFNGGVFKSSILRERMLEVWSSWTDRTEKPTMLGAVDDLELAVASGAAFYGWSKVNGGVRIRGGTPMSYYVGIESTGPAVPGMTRPLQAVCVAPQGMEEGTEAIVPGREFGLVLGKLVKFRFFASNSRPSDSIGTHLRSWEDGELIETNPIELKFERSSGSESTRESESALKSESMLEGRNIVPVRFLSKISELGMFELWCTSTRDASRWKLTFSIRP